MAINKDTPKDVAAYLKKRFSAGATPNADDYAKLIELADHGRQAIGLLEDMTRPLEPKTPGLTLTKDGRLQVNTDPKTSGLKVDEKGVAVNSGQGIKLTDKGVEIKSTGALTTEPNGDLQVKPGAGLHVDDATKTIALQVDTKSGLGVTGNALTVQLTKKEGKDASGLEVSGGNTLQLRVKSTDLTLGAEGLGLAADAKKNLKAEFKSVTGEVFQEVEKYSVVELSGEPDAKTKFSEFAKELDDEFRKALGVASNIKSATDGLNLTGWAKVLCCVVRNAVLDGQEAIQANENGDDILGAKNTGLATYFCELVKSALDDAVNRYPQHVTQDGEAENLVGNCLQRAIESQLALAHVKGREAGYTSPKEFEDICKDGVSRLIAANGSANSFKYTLGSDFPKGNYWMIAGAAAKVAWEKGKDKGDSDGYERGRGEGYSDGVMLGKKTLCDMVSGCEGIQKIGVARDSQHAVIIKVGYDIGFRNDLAVVVDKKGNTFNPKKTHYGHEYYVEAGNDFDYILLFGKDGVYKVSS